MKVVKDCNPGYRHPGVKYDRLFESGYEHRSGNECEDCDGPVIPRNARRPRGPHVHYGLIASGNQVVKDARLRDSLAVVHNVLCFEMEAAGVMNSIPCLVIRGICDYADTHKNKQWQEYAAATAAAYAKLLLSVTDTCASPEDLGVGSEHEGSCSLKRGMSSATGSLSKRSRRW